MKPIIIGVYSILYTPTRRNYIGQSQDVYGRWDWHKYMLSQGKHHSPKLQRAWDKYGSEKFLFVMLEECELDHLDDLEQFWIDKTYAYEKGYNCQPIAGSARGYKLNEDQKIKAVENLRRLAADPDQRKIRSENAKRQHAEGNFGRKTWSENSEKRQTEKLRETYLNNPSLRYRFCNQTKEIVAKRILMRRMSLEKE